MEVHRYSLPGIPEVEVDSAGAIGGTYLAASQSHVDDYYEGLVTAGLIPVLLHAEGSPVTTPIEITSHEVDAKVATQRRRLRR